MSTVTKRAEMMFEDVTEGMSEFQTIKEQQEFIRFLQAQGWYDEMISTDDMQKWHAIWKRAKAWTFGKPAMIEAQLDQMLKDAGDDPQLVHMAWQVASTLYEFYSNQYADIYHDDPMSQHAPRECFDLHMSPWKELHERIQQESYPARCRFEEHMAALHDLPPEIEEMPF